MKVADFFYALCFPQVSKHQNVNLRSISGRIITKEMWRINSKVLYSEYSNGPWRNLPPEISLVCLFVFNKKHRNLLWMWRISFFYFKPKNSLKIGTAKHLFEKEFRETSQNFNSFSSFRQFLFLWLSDWVEIFSSCLPQ